MSILRSHLVRAVSLSIATLVFATQLAQAQPRSHGGGGEPHVAPLAMILLSTEVHAALALSSDQETQWTALQAAEQTLRTQRETARANLETLIAAEFADSLPDLVAIENTIVAEHQTAAAAATAVSSQAIALYSTLSVSQQAIVVAAARARNQHAPRRP